jgi:hypothetical protein
LQRVASGRRPRFYRHVERPTARSTGFTNFFSRRRKDLLEELMNK